jgi:chromosome segregation ATPase
MENLTEDFERIEQELQELRSRFSRADLVLSELEEIQTQFECLAKTYKHLDEEVSQFNARSKEMLGLIKQDLESFRSQFARLRDANELKLDELNSQFRESQEELRTHDSSLQTLLKNMDLLKQDFHKSIEPKISSIQTDSHKIKKQMKTMWGAILVLFLICLFLFAKILQK